MPTARLRIGRDAPSATNAGVTSQRDGGTRMTASAVIVSWPIDVNNYVSLAFGKKSHKKAAPVGFTLHDN